MITIGVQFTTRQDVPSQNAASGTENCIIRASVHRYRPRPCSVSPRLCPVMSGYVRQCPAAVPTLNARLLCPAASLPCVWVYGTMQALHPVSCVVCYVITCVCAVSHL